MPINDQDNSEESCLCLGVINGSAKGFTRTYNEGETNIQILIVCVGVFAFTICQDFCRALWRTLKN